MSANMRDLHSLRNSDDTQSGGWFAQSSALWIAGVVLFILIFGATLFLGFQHFNEARNRALASDKITANLLADILMEHNNATLGILQSYAHRPLFVNAVKSKNVAGVHRHLSDLKKNGEIDLTFVTDKHGVLWANFPVFPEAIGKDLSSRDWYQGISGGWKPYISKVFQLIVGDKPLAAAVCVPVTDEKERVIGILATSLRLGFIGDIVQRIPLSPHTRVTVIDRAGQILYSNIFSYRENITIHPFFPSIETALKAKRQQIEIKNPQNNQEKINLCVVPVGTTGWSVVVGRTQSDILRLEFNRFAELGVFSFLLVLLLVSLLVYLKKVSLLNKTEELLKTEAKLRQTEEEFRIIFDNNSSAMAIINKDTTILMVNREYCKMSLYEEEDVVGKSWTTQIPQEDLERLKEYNRKRLIDPKSVPNHYEFMFYRKDGKIRHALMSVAIMPISQKIICSFADITDRKQAEEALRVAEETYRNIFLNSQIGLFRTDLQTGLILDANDTVAHFIGYPGRASLLAEPFNMAERYVDAHVRDEMISLARAQGEIHNFEARFRRNDGSIIWIRFSAKIVREKGWMEGVSEDITSRKHAEELLREANTYLENLINYANAPIIVWNPQFCITRFNHAFESLTGRSEAEVIGQSLEILFPSALVEDSMALIRKTLTGERWDIIEIKIQHRDESVRTVLWNSATLFAPDGKTPIATIAQGQDITERKHAEEALVESEKRFRELSIIDELTSLYNSRHFYFQLKIELERSNRHKQPITLLLLDLDDFKAFNDTYGHIGGDQVLRRLGHVIKRCLRETDSAYRYGGEEFTILLPMTTSADGAITAERIRTEFKKEIFLPVPDQEVHLTVSIGLSQYKPPEDIKDFVRRVDQLMYQAKKSGKDRVCSEA